MVSRNVLTCIFSILFVHFAATDLISNEIQVLENYAIVNFPESIEFVFSLESEASVNGVTLIYGTNSASCSSAGSRQPLDLDSDKNIELEWLWDLRRSGAVPPGAEIWWQWEIEDEDGYVETTDRQFTIVTDDRHHWQEVSGSDVTVYWYEGDSAFGQSVLTLAIDSLERLRSEAGIMISNPVQLWIYPTAADVRNSVVNTHEWTGGVAFSDYGVAAIGLRPGQDEWANEVIPHELAHLVGGVAVANCRGGRLPTWLSEGLAEFSSGGTSQSDLVNLEDRLANERLPTLHSLARGFSAYAGGAELAYAQSAQVVQYMIEAYGPEKLAELLDHIRLGQSIDDALEATYDFNTAGLDAEWRISKGFEPVANLAADSAQLEASPTIIPTLALAVAPLPATATPTAPLAATETTVPTGSPTVLASIAVAPPTDTRTPAVVLAIRGTSTAMAETAVPSRSESAESSNVSLALWAVGIGLVILIGMIILVRNKGG